MTEQMHFIVENEALAKALVYLKGIVRTVTTIPILTHVAVTAGDKEILVRANNPDRDAEARLPAEVMQAGAAALRGEVLQALAKGLTRGGQCEVSLVGDRAHLVAGSLKYYLRTLPIADFPGKKSASEPVEFSLSAAELRAQAMACQTRTRAWGFNGGPTAHGQCRSDRSGSGTMPILPNNRHELFAQGLAKGLSADAAYQAAGYKPNRGNAATLKANQSISKRVEELQAAAAAKTVLSRQWVIERLVETVERAMQAVPHLDHEGNPTGVFTYQGNVAIKALELLGKELGMFQLRPPGEEENPLVLRPLIDAPPDETREQWLARTARERGLPAPAIVGAAVGSADGGDSKRRRRAGCAAADLASTGSARNGRGLAATSVQGAQDLTCSNQRSGRRCCRYISS
jgi:phage terminase small subunit